MVAMTSRRRGSVPRNLLTGAAVGLAAALAIASCGGDAEEKLVSPCVGELADKCGDSCGDIGDCPTGTYCGTDSTCTADCVPGGDHCPEGKACDGSGRCVDQLLGNGGSSGDASFGDGCINAEITYEKQIPTVVLLIDQSGSMTESFGGSTRWDVVHDALMNPSTGIVKQLESEVRFGLALYTSHDGNAGGQCPILTEVAMKLGNYAAIKAVYDAASPDSETPTGESIDEVVKTLVPYPEPGPKVIVLATDGEPDTCAQPNPQNGQPEAVKAAQDAHAKGIETYIISVGAGVSLAHLQDMANAGKGTPVGGSQNEPYYQALDQKALYDAFQTIIYGVRPCTLQLNGTVDPKDAGQGQVWLDGTALGYQDQDGWQMNGPSEIELLGAACDAIKTGDHKIQIQFPCGVFQPPS